jgi:paraquat-inducible protein B
MADAEASVTERRRISPIWIVPIVAVLLGAYMVVHTLRSQGPEITIVFSSAASLEAEKTKIKLRDVEVGLVEVVALGDDLESVEVTARLEKAAEPLLREDTQFWVVRPRIGAGGVSGLGTLHSGGYIQLEPGTGKGGRREFVGLDTPPVTPVGTPGLHLQLVSERAGSVSTGDPILYRGFRVGSIEADEFPVESQAIRYRAVIEAPYDDLVTSSTRFWNASGITFSATADGIELDTGSLQTLLLGGVTFGLPEGIDAGSPVDTDAAFDLYPDYAAVNARPYRHSLEYVVQFDQSVRGLVPGAPVEYRGIQIGRVERVLLHEVASSIQGEGISIPVLIRIEPGRLTLPDSDQSTAQLDGALVNAVRRGLRASLATGNLLTGRLYVSLDLYPNADPAEVGTYMERRTIPTVASGFEGIQVQLTALLTKLNALPLEDVAESAAAAVANLNSVLASREMQELPATVEGTLEELQGVLESVSLDSALQDRLLATMTELDRTLAALRNVLSTLDDQPNSVIFPRDLPPDPVPPAGTP